MQHILSLLYKGFRKLFFRFKYFCDGCLCRVLFYLNKIKHEGLSTKGIPKIMVARGGYMSIGKGFRMNNTPASNPIGCMQPCMFFVNCGAKLIIGENTNISQTALVCHTDIYIGDNVKIGGGVCIYDTDFHSLDKMNRMSMQKDFENKKVSPITIEDNVFIGAYSTILKGVTIGENSIIGACSLVANSVPANEIWGGNPAKKIKSISS
ncbi:acyltransferase [Hyunsoonleella sp. 2307UL5-6]|uniref:acyltransferase n=1 Tax=Hyunsoonleella sp. 2307UL5-6 TaxID=3384768 RepID=UPI0039BCF58E